MSEQRTLARSAAIASITVAVILVVLKSWASWRTGSTAMLGSLADSALDLIASLATLTGVWIASMPADEDHRFGHGKAEALAAIFQIMLIVLSAFGIAARAVTQLAGGGETAAAAEGIGVSLVAIVLTFALLGWQSYVMRRTRSLAIQTDHLHYKSDLLLNLSVIAALMLDQYAGLGLADPLFGLAIAAWLAFGAWRGASEAVDALMDREWPESRRIAFVEAAARHPELSNLHDLRTRTSGNRDFVQFHVDLPPAMTIEQAHAIIERVEEDLCGQFPGMELLIHIDPEGHVDEPGNPLVEDDEFAKLEKDA
mgnify:CR=1 FL=1